MWSYFERMLQNAAGNPGMNDVNKAQVFAAALHQPTCTP
jgi:hypothetical protein